LKGTTMPKNKNLNAQEYKSDSVWELLDMLLFLPEDENIHEQKM